MTAVYVLLKNLSIELLRLRVVTGESLVGVGDEDTTVAGTLHGSEDARPSRRALQTNIEVALEWPGCVFVVEGFGEDKGTIWLSDTFVLVG